MKASDGELFQSYRLGNGEAFDELLNRHAQPLLASQQFETALRYLAEAGGSMGLLQATHLAIMLSVAGIPVQDVGGHEPSRSILTDLLVAYASKLEMDPASGAKGSLLYLLRISPKKDALKHVSD